MRVHDYEKLLHTDDEGLEILLASAKETCWRNFGKRIHFYAPTFAYYENEYYSPPRGAFPSISITGRYCALNCKHCGGRVLRTMLPALTPESLLRACTELKKRGALGCLISGGCLSNGSVPLEKFTDAIAKIKRELGLTIAIHTGLVDSSLAKKLKEADVDVAMIDVIGSDETIHEIYGLDASVRDFESSLRTLRDSGIPTVPHVIVGLHYGRLKGEIEALKMISRHHPSAIVIIAFMPIRGTAMEAVSPPRPEDIARVLATARLTFPRVPISLGCMRPLGGHRVKTDALAIMSGVNAMAFPTTSAVRLAKKLGYGVSFSPLCCSLSYLDVKLK